LTLGDDVFLTMIRAWVAEHRFGTVSTELFEEHAARYGRTGALLGRWLHGMPLPDLPPA
jgi:aminopeptidase N